MVSVGGEWWINLDGIGGLDVWGKGVIGRNILMREIIIIRVVWFCFGVGEVVGSFVVLRKEGNIWLGCGGCKGILCGEGVKFGGIR
jgi:hypothetical protein